MQLNTAFHAQLHGNARRPRMIALVEHLRRLTDRYLHLHLAVLGGVERLQQEHQQILDAARDRDAAAVAECTRVHLATSHDFVLSYLLEHDFGTDQPARRRRDCRRSPIPTRGLLIAGEEVPAASGDTIPVLNPATGSRSRRSRAPAWRT